MEASTISLFLTLSLIAATAAGQDSSQPQRFLDAHNLIRAKVGVQPLVWNDTVAGYALGYARFRSENDCSLVNSRGPYGENLAIWIGKFSEADMVNGWVSESRNYNPTTNSCIGGPCEHYTQVVWRGTTQLGCAQQQCTDGFNYTICSYYPPVTIAGQRPF